MLLDIIFRVFYAPENYTPPIRKYKLLPDLKYHFFSIFSSKHTQGYNNKGLFSKSKKYSKQHKDAILQSLNHRQ